MKRWNPLISGVLVILGLASCSTSLPGRGVAPASTTAESAASGTTTGDAVGKSVFDRPAVQAGVVNLLKNSYNMDATAASCPDAATTEVKAGNTFSCTVTIDGAQKNVTVTVKDAEGTYDVSVPS